MNKDALSVRLDTLGTQHAMYDSLHINELGQNFNSC